ncbi:MAG TPA: class I SAM-dependent methyltransferase [Bacteroidota bacterium]|nr:class I SAM-dependent methyltransferase [Bacteroidota bacterium]
MEITEAGRKYWQYEYDVMAQYLLPLMREWGVKIEGATVLDVGCGDGGGISAMYDAGMHCKGFDITQPYIDLAHAMSEGRKMEMFVGSIYANPIPLEGERFDVVILHDVFEHLERKTYVLETLKKYLLPSGQLVITFPPYYSAFGAHQQFLSARYGKIPFFHLMPFAVSGIIPKLKNEQPHLVEEIQKLARLKMGIGNFEHLLRETNYRIEKKKFYTIGPNHIRFGLKPLGAGVVGSIPGLRELLVSGVVYLLSAGNGGRAK